MNEPLKTKTVKLVGSFIRKRRESLGLSQRALGMMFDPPVTTQFISNIERGVTPLPPAHVPTLTKALLVSEEEFLALLEREYTAKLSDRLGKGEGVPQPVEGTPPASELVQLVISHMDYDFIRNLYDAYRQADPKTRQAFTTVCESMLNLPKAQPSGGSSEEQK